MVSSTMGNSGYCAATVSSWADRIRCCQSGERDLGSRRGSSRARAALSRNRAANSADPPTSSVTTDSSSSGSITISSALGGSDSVSGMRSTMPSLVAVACTSIPYRCRAACSTARAQGASTAVPRPQCMQTRQSPSSSRNRSTTIVWSVGSAPVAACCSAR